MPGPRRQDERDAFALVTGGLLAAAVFVAVGAPALFGGVGGGSGHAWRSWAGFLAAAAFAVRVVAVLRRLPRGGAPGPGADVPPDPRG
ncbi:DUF6332 family protein [Streptomyces sp. B1866]|uniref:DUF6332 family protein n=1 Tax=Streptomyces sp. B1866 TaxID=3075431 RepID=UPI00288E24CD|nr:DUF6332 family protein [Streptomyces sp. B1866]MDT3398821.1 DUF6332 family protein [Streptomyces sp. B1866]